MDKEDTGSISIAIGLHLTEVDKMSTIVVVFSVERF
jgi:hypothetical protein